MAERINSFNPRSILDHEEMAHVIRTGTTNGTHQTIPHQLQHFLENMKKQYLSFIDTMQVIKERPFVKEPINPTGNAPDRLAVKK